LGVAEDAKERRKRVLDDLRKSPLKTIGKKVLNPADLIREDRDR
jgi:hypothetical protein